MSDVQMLGWPCKHLYGGSSAHRKRPVLSDVLLQDFYHSVLHEISFLHDKSINLTRLQRNRSTKPCARPTKHFRFISILVRIDALIPIHRQLG